MKKYRIRNKTIIFDWGFNQNIDKKIIQVIIQYSVENIYFKNNYDKESKYNDKSSYNISNFDAYIDDLPISIKTIVFSDKFNNYLDNLPDSITSLTFGPKYFQPLDNLPNSLTTLKLYCKITASELYDLPNSIIELTLFNNEYTNYEYIPDTVKSLTILSDCKINKFPNSIRQLHLFANVLFDELPDTITYLTIGKEFKRKFNKYPKELKEIKKYNLWKDNFVTSTIEYINH